MKIFILLVCGAAVSLFATNTAYAKSGDGTSSNPRNKVTVADIQHPSHHAMAPRLSASQDSRHFGVTSMQSAQRRRNGLSAQGSAALNQRQTVASG